MKTVIVTGASGGIGGAIAVAFAKAGYGVAVNYNASPEKAESVCEEIKALGGFAFAVKADISDGEQVKRLFDEAKKRFHKGADVLVNNAGVSLWGLFADIEEERFKRLFEINVFGTMLCCREALPYMTERKNGCIINISSIWGISGASCETHYSASKAAVIGFTKALALETAPSGINVNCIAPGVIDTTMNGNLSAKELEALKEQIPLGRIGKPAEIAELALFLAEKGQYITGQVISSNGGLVI